MKKNYRHLSAEECAVIMIEHTKDTSATSKVTRELKRNCEAASAHYDATRAACAYRTRREHCVRRRRLMSGSQLYQHIHNRRVYWRWSRQQIAARLRRMYPDDPDHSISHETIYAAIYAHPRGERSHVR
ncbi:transposase [Pandoraea soli]|uniref:Transposase n=1 Tax=Pandoraea soli TaxID=2508293 RepID=A0ABY6WA80_9BURK|nr:hypothetical protein [Pandoraea soli]VVE45308.1 transposase [Pandoraea soli]